MEMLQILNQLVFRVPDLFANDSNKPMKYCWTHFKQEKSISKYYAYQTLCRCLEQYPTAEHVQFQARPLTFQYVWSCIRSSKELKINEYTFPWNVILDCRVVILVWVLFGRHILQAKIWSYLGPPPAPSFLSFPEFSLRKPTLHSMISTLLCDKFSAQFPVPNLWFCSQLVRSLPKKVSLWVAGTEPR